MAYELKSNCEIRPSLSKILDVLTRLIHIVVYWLKITFRINLNNFTKPVSHLSVHSNMYWSTDECDYVHEITNCIGKDDLLEECMVYSPSHICDIIGYWSLIQHHVQQINWWWLKGHVIIIHKFMSAHTIWMVPSFTYN